VNAGIIDTNIFLRHFLQDQPDQGSQSSAFFGKIRQGEIEAVLLPTVVLEIVFILERQYRASRENVYAILSEVLELSELKVVDRPQLLDAAHEYRNRRSVSFADAYHCAMARDFHDGVIVSFDRKLSGIDGVTRKEPGEI
jgi:predicted nucleic-acid-binding protein